MQISLIECHSFSCSACFGFKKKVTWVLDHPGWVFNTMSSSRLKNWPGHQSSIWSAHRLLICCLFEWPTGHCTNACVASLPLTIIQKSYMASSSNWMVNRVHYIKRTQASINYHIGPLGIFLMSVWPVFLWKWLESAYGKQ